MLDPNDPIARRLLEARKQQDSTPMANVALPGGATAQLPLGEVLVLKSLEAIHIDLRIIREHLVKDENPDS